MSLAALPTVGFDAPSPNLPYLGLIEIAGETLPIPGQREHRANQGGSMKTVRRLGLITILGGLAILGFGNLPWRRLANLGTPVVRAAGGGIVGSWINTVTVNTPPGAPPFVFPELLSANPGGTFIDSIAIAHSSQNPFLVGPFAPLAVDLSDAFGVWQPVSNTSNQFAITLKRLIFGGADTPTSAYGTFFPGQYIGTADIQAVGTLQHSQSGDTLAGPFTFQLRNLSGEVVLAASGTFSAKRLTIEPLATN
jgi:hypothetical protein